MAGSSKQFVYLPSVRKNTWLLWSKRADTVYLREYTLDRCEIVKELGLQEAETLLALPASRIESSPCFNRISVTRTGFWFQFSKALNIRDGFVQVDEKDKLQAIFKLQCQGPLEDGETKQLEALFAYWKSLFSKIKHKDERINHYDHKDTSNLFKDGSGKIWQSALLENSRRGGKACFVNTANPLTDFSFAAMELTLSISAKDNPFFPKAESRIAPDGLGVRRNGYLTVLEVKGASDEKDLLGPLLQATCGALAVVAVQENLCKILRTSTGLRPKYDNARVPKRSSIGIHILTSKHKNRGRLELWSDEHEALCKRVLTAFPQLEYIAYSFVVPDHTDGFKKLAVDHLITRE